MCALRTDIERMPHGDETLIIDNGLNLSRGQQARINLARAIYKDTDIYLLDDPLSALDGNVSRFIFNNCIKEYLKNKICVIVTHQRHHLKDVDKIIYLRDGKVLIEGTYDMITSSNYAEELLKNQIDLDNVNEEEILIDDSNVDVTEIDQLLTKRIVFKENQKMGKVDFAMYKTYFESAKKPFLLLIIIILFLVAQGSASYFDYFITRW